MFHGKDGYYVCSVAACEQHRRSEKEVRRAITDLDELHPLHSLGADGHHGEADGGANNAVSPGDRQFEEGGD